MSLRLFLALEPPAAVLAEVRRAADHLRRALPGLHARYPDPQATHLTLVFLGQVAPADVELVEHRAAAVAHAHAAFPARTTGLGAFPSPRRPSVLWLGVDDVQGRLAALQNELAGALAPLLPERTNPRFVPHLTLARVSGLGGFGRHEVAGALGRYGAGATAWPVTELALIRSRLHPDGARYQTLARWPLDRQDAEG